MKARFFSLLKLLCCFLITSSINPLHAQIVLVGDNVEQTMASPGDQYSGSVLIHNESDSALTVRVYQDGITALTSFDTGSEIKTIDRSNADWIKHTSGRVTIQSGEIAEFAYQVVVPLRLTTEPYAGTYWSTLSVDVVALGASEFVRPYSRHRLAEVTTQIEGSGEKEIAINSFKLVGERKERKLQAVVINTGNVVVEPEIWFELYDVSGAFRERIAGTSKTVFPGGFDRPQIDVSHLKPGIYEAQIIIDAGEDKVFGTSCTLDMTGTDRIAQTGVRRTIY